MARSYPWAVPLCCADLGLILVPALAHVVREIVGHSAIEVTMTIYAHMSSDEKRKALGELGETLG